MSKPWLAGEGIKEEILKKLLQKKKDGYLQQTKGRSLLHYFYTHVPDEHNSPLRHIWQSGRLYQWLAESSFI